MQIWNREIVHREFFFEKIRILKENVIVCQKYFIFFGSKIDSSQSCNIINPFEKFLILDQKDLDYML
jgi:hypothetical protein